MGNRNKNIIMVNDIRMATIYQGMSMARLEKLNKLHDQAYLKVARAFVYTPGVVGLAQAEREAEYADFDNQVEAEFMRLCARAAKKADWNFGHKTATNIRPTRKSFPNSKVK